MASEIREKCSALIDRLYFPVAALFFMALAYDHFQLITYQLPLDYNEPAQQTITATIASGGNPYSIDNVPARISAYPILYNMIVASMTGLFGNTLQLHRLVTGIFILASCLLVFFTCNRLSKSSRDSLAASSLLYAGLLFYATPIASPTSLGLLLFLSCLLIPWFYHFSNRSLAAALVLGVLAFYGKQYFIACLGYLALYLFLAVSKTRGIIFGVLSLIGLLASLALTNYIAPYFLDIAIFAGSGMKYVASYQTMLTQLLDYAMISLPLIAILAIQSARTFFTKTIANEASQTCSKAKLRLNLKDLSAPLLNHQPDYIWYCCLCSLMVIIFILGKNPGNYLSYHFQIVSPFLLAGTLIMVSRATKCKIFYQLLVFISFYVSYTLLSHDYSVKNLQQWQKLEQVIANADRVYGPPAILGPILKNGGEIFQNGHTIYYVFALNKPSFMVKEKPEETAAHIWNTYINNIHTMIEAQEFDLVVLDQWTGIPDPPPGTDDITGQARLQKYYRQREVIPIYLANRRGGGMYRMQLWEPIPKTSSERIMTP